MQLLTSCQQRSIQSLSLATPLASSLRFIIQHGAILYGISLWTVWVSSISSCPSQFLVHPQLLSGRAVWEAEKSLA